MQNKIGGNKMRQGSMLLEAKNLKEKDVLLKDKWQNDLQVFGIASNKNKVKVLVKGFNGGSDLLIFNPNELLSVVKRLI